jgi:hypothetical protein
MNNFVGQYFLDDLTICDELIDFYKNFEDKEDAKLHGKTDHTRKKCTEIFFNAQDLNNAYTKNLQLCIDKYVEKFKFCNDSVPWGLIEPVKIQYYKTSEAYHTWHSERVGAKDSRYLVFMTYLNDVEDGGETEFYYQELKIKPKKGLTLIWPADWTHTHRGVPSNTQEKYIITGWLNLLE